MFPILGISHPATAHPLSSHQSLVVVQPSYFHRLTDSSDWHGVWLIRWNFIFPGAIQLFREAQKRRIRNQDWREECKTSGKTFAMAREC
jgi:hypothetical protein